MLVISPAAGIAVPLRKTHPLCLWLHELVIDEFWRYFRILRNDFRFSAGSAEYARDCNPAPLPLWNTRVLGVRIKQARCTCFATQEGPKAVWSRRLRNTQVSPCQWSVNCCVQACKRKRAKVLMLGYRQQASPLACCSWKLKYHLSQLLFLQLQCPGAAPA